MNAIMILATVAAIGFLSALMLGSPGCTPQQAKDASASIARVENVVLADLQQGKTLPQIEVDVALTLHVGNPTVDAIVVRLVDDVLAILIDSGVLPPELGPIAGPMKAQAHAKRLILPDAGP